MLRRLEPDIAGGEAALDTRDKSHNTDTPDTTVLTGGCPALGTVAR
jgi:hypothetical protein